MPGRQHFGAQFSRGRQQIAELDGHITFDARHRRLAVNVTFRKAIDDRFLKATFIVEHVVRDANALGNAARIVDVLPSATRTLAMDRSAMVVKLQRHTNHVIALRLEQGGSH